MQLEIRNLIKQYKNKTALNGISLKLSTGIYGLLGPNGAGKSTLMNIISGNISPSSGKILLDGEDINERSRSFRSVLGYMPQQQSLYPDFMAYDFLAYMSTLRGMKRKAAATRIPEVLEQVGLLDRSGDKIKSFSGGMKQRLLIAQAILADPKVLILDEPTAGLDPKQRIAIRNLISQIAADKIVIIATHIVSDVELVANRFLLLKAGEIIADDTREGLCSLLQGKVWELYVDEDTLNSIQENGSFQVGNISREGNHFYVRVIAEKEPEAYSHLPMRPTLEDVYQYCYPE